MRRYLFIFIFISLLLFTSKTSYAFGPVFKVIDGAVKATRVSESLPNLIPFGGRITSTGTACKVKFWIWQLVYGIPIPCPNCGIIPIAGTVIDVDIPGIPASNVFTFPGVTKIYANHNEDKVGAMTLGLALKSNITKQITDKINSGLSKIPRIPLPNGWADRFRLYCPDGNIIRKIGTSKPE